MPEIPADLQVLLDRVAEGAARACGADEAVVRLLEGDQLHGVGTSGGSISGINAGLLYDV